MRYLGIDYGEKRIGLALSDPEGRLAFPREIVPNGRNRMCRIVEVAEEEKVDEIVLGESLDSEGKPNEIMREINKFASELASRLSLPIRLEKEFFTSVEARRYRGSEERADASAAALILQRYLDRMNNKQK